MLAAPELASAITPRDDFEPLDPTTIFATPETMPSPKYSLEQLQRGRYMFGLLGCGRCNTDHTLVGSVNQSRLLAGSSTGIAYNSHFLGDFPGVVYPPNLTPDLETGLGSWTMKRLIQMIIVGTIDQQLPMFTSGFIRAYLVNSSCSVSVTQLDVGVDVDALRYLHMSENLLRIKAG